MKKWKAIIFDMDGTLFDTERIAKMAWYAYGEQYNAPITDEFTEILTGVNMNAVPAIWKKYMPDHLSQDEAFEFLHAYMRSYKKEHGPLPKTDLHKFFDILEERGYRLALCSSSSEATIDLNLSFDHLKERFEVIVNGFMTERGKPAPDIYLLTASKLNLDPKECLVVEDSRNGILSGHNAGMDVIIIKDITEHPQEIKDIALCIIDHLDELLAFV